MLKLFYKVLLFFSVCLIFAPAQAEVLPLKSEKAFVFSAYLEKPTQLTLAWQIAPGYYLYRDKFKIQADSGGVLKKQHLQWPASQKKRDPLRGFFRAYEGRLQLRLPLATHQDLTFTIQYQGCSQKGFCYAPIKKQLQLRYPFSAQGLSNAPLVFLSEAAASETPAPSLLTDQETAKAFLSRHALGVTLLCFLGLGLLLAFTPCTLPMIPILASIIVGQKHLTTRHAFQLSLSYVLGSSLTYALAGLFMAWVGSGVQAYFQNPWVLGAFSLLFVFLALSMLGFVDLRFSKTWQQWILQWQQRQKGGRYLGVFLMGCLSTLIVSPCVTAPLVGVLAYISETGNMFLGALALFVLGLGMGLPLLLLGFSAGRYLPKAGPWMVFIQKLFAFLLLGMALWMLTRILPSGVLLFLWACFFMLAAVFLFFTEGLSGVSQKVAYFSGALFVGYALLLFVGVSMNASSLFYPFEAFALKKPALSSPQALAFIELKSIAQLDRLLSAAKRAEKPVLIDFYADWCESCQALEQTVLSQEEVKARLGHFVLLRANVTENNAFDQVLLKRYQVVAPPTFLFFNREGQERMEKRIVGEVDPHLFLAHANTL